ncbi:hypothetical protein [Actinomadura sp. 7K507]|uniref:hypothetical protein n=1 Tax=Actinomadura sp. 7K507 TaxID=2530365 RepID=UPI0010493C1F|nr:hypothetical protein [Actinomadura sp. 7K507]TDC95618.1 hypothetical protein E1285_07050 [Actinomadura sp. 7K507]
MVSTALIGTLTLWVAARPRPAVGDYAREPRIALCGRLAIGSLVVSFVALHLISSTDKGLWTVLPLPLTYLCGALTLAQALFLLPVIICTLPRHEPIANPRLGRRPPAPRTSVSG